MPCQDLVPLASFVREVNLAGLGPVAYRRLYDLVIAGEIPAERVGRCWCVRRADKTAIVSQFSPPRAA